MMIFTLAWRNLWRNKRRTLITAASVFFAVILATFMRSLQSGVTQQMVANVVSFYSGYVQVHKDGYWDDQNLENSFEELPVIRAAVTGHPEVADAAPRLESFALAAFGDYSEPCMVVGIDPIKEDQLTTLKAKLKAGEYFLGDASDAVIADGLAEKLQLALGDTLVLIGQGYHGVSAAGKYAISGMVHFGSPELNNRLVYLPLNDAQEFYGAHERITSYALNLNEPSAARKVTMDLREEVDTEEYEVMDWREMMPEMQQLLDADKGKGVMFMGILYTIVAFGIFGTVLMMMAERRYELGVMIALGMKKRLLASVVMMETIFVSMVGVLAGLVVSLPLVSYFHFNPIPLTEEMAKAYAEFGFEAVLPVALDPGIFMAQAATVLVFAILISFFPAWKIRNTDPVKAMKQ